MIKRKKNKNDQTEDKICELEDKIEYLTHMVESLATAHNAPTKECGNVTFKELARYVIDKEPIAREITHVTYFEHPDTTQAKAEETVNNHGD